MQTYKAQIVKDRIKWLGRKPKELVVDGENLFEVKFINNKSANKPKNDLVEFFRNSPLYGVELDLERDKDTGRNIDL